MTTNEAIDDQSLTEEQRTAFYGLLFAMSAIDGSMDEVELELIYGSIALDGLSEQARARVHEYMIDPPPVDALLALLDGSDPTVRYGALVHLVDVAYADDVVLDSERRLIETARATLGIDQAQAAAIEEFVQVTRQVRARGVDDEVGKDMLKRAIAGLTAVSVPTAAACFSGTIVGMSAAGLLSGLAALGLGAGVFPGIGVALLLGAVVYLGTTKILDVGSSRKKADVRVDRERRAQIAANNIEDALRFLQHRLEVVRGRASVPDLEADELAQRMENLRHLLKHCRLAAQGSAPPPAMPAT